MKAIYRVIISKRQHLLTALVGIIILSVVGCGKGGTATPTKEPAKITSVAVEEGIYVATKFESIAITNTDTAYTDRPATSCETNLSLALGDNNVAQMADNCYYVKDTYSISGDVLTKMNPDNTIFVHGKVTFWMRTISSMLPANLNLDIPSLMRVNHNQ